MSLLTAFIVTVLARDGIAGKQSGMGEGTRSGLWSEIIRLVGELRPQYVIVENVANLLSGPSSKPGGWFGRILGDLAECGYDAEWENIPASALGAPHRRDRVWIVGWVAIRRDVSNADADDGLADSMRERLPQFNGFRDSGQTASSIFKRGEFERICSASRQEQWSIEPDVGRVANGVPDRAHRLAALGNAVVPQIPRLIGRAILESHWMAILYLTNPFRIRIFQSRSYENVCSVQALFPQRGSRILPR